MTDTKPPSSRTTTSIQLAGDDPVLLAAVQRARKLLHRRALTGAAASTVPVPGVDWLVDAALLSRLLPAINAAFGLTPEQLQALPQRKQEQVQQAAGAVGSIMVGKFITRDLVLRAAKMIGKRMVIKQVTKFVPFAGQAVSALLGYSAIRRIGEQHIRDCVEVCKIAQVEPPPMDHALAPTVKTPRAT